MNYVKFKVDDVLYTVYPDMLELSLLPLMQNGWNFDTVYTKWQNADEDGDVYHSNSRFSKKLLMSMLNEYRNGEKNWMQFRVNGVLYDVDPNNPEESLAPLYTAPARLSYPLETLVAEKMKKERTIRIPNSEITIAVRTYYAKLDESFSSASHPVDEWSQTYLAEVLEGKRNNKNYQYSIYRKVDDFEWVKVNSMDELTLEVPDPNNPADFASIAVKASDKTKQYALAGGLSFSLARAWARR